jgi:quercetin dioxygenase-like cupin family protein
MTIELKNVEPYDIAPGYHARFVHGKTMTLAYVDIDAGAEIPEHSHVHEQVLNMLEGSFILCLAGKDLHLEPGQVVVIPSNVPHSGRAVRRCKILDVFHPVREDFVAKSVDYNVRNKIS